MRHFHLVLVRADHIEVGDDGRGELKLRVVVLVVLAALDKVPRQVEDLYWAGHVDEIPTHDGVVAAVVDGAVLVDRKDGGVEVAEGGVVAVALGNPASESGWL